MCVLVPVDSLLVGVLYRERDVVGRPSGVYAIQQRWVRRAVLQPTGRWIRPHKRGRFRHEVAHGNTGRSVRESNRQARLQVFRNGVHGGAFQDGRQQGHRCGRNGARVGVLGQRTHRRGEGRVRDFRVCGEGGVGEGGEVPERGVVTLGSDRVVEEREVCGEGGGEGKERRVRIAMGASRKEKNEEGGPQPMNNTYLGFFVRRLHLREQ